MHGREQHSLLSSPAKAPASATATIRSTTPTTGHGDFTLIARITDISDTLNYTGLMMRESVDGHAPAATVLHAAWAGVLPPSARASPGAEMAWTTGNKFTWRPAWFKAGAPGRVFSAYQSVDGSKWFWMSSSEILMAGTHYVGLVACSGDSTQFRIETTTFDFVGSARPRQGGLAAGGAGTPGTDKPTASASRAGLDPPPHASANFEMAGQEPPLRGLNGQGINSRVYLPVRRLATVAFH